MVSNSPTTGEVWVLEAARLRLIGEVPPSQILKIVRSEETRIAADGGWRYFFDIPAHVRRWDTYQQGRLDAVASILGPEWDAVKASGRAARR